MKNENKVNLILFIARTFDEEQCGALLDSFVDRLANEKVIVANKGDWKEHEHPRDNIGRFAPNGSDRSSMTKKEVERWDKIGKSNFSDRRTAKKKAEISKLKKLQSSCPKNGDNYNYLESKIVRAQRELSELERDIKMSKRLSHEGKVSKRIQAKRVKQFYETEEEIDYLEEKYADRNPDSPTQGDVVFPKTKRGEKDKARYERLKTERDELNEEIDWESVVDEEDI